MGKVQNKDKPRGPNYGSYDRLEIEAFILTRVVSNIKERTIIAALRDTLGLDGWNHDQIQNVKRTANKQGRYRQLYTHHEGPDAFKMLSTYLHTKYPATFKQLQSIYTAEASDIAKLGADTLCNEIATYFERNKTIDEIHIGIAGGRTTGLMAEPLVAFLSDESRWSKLVLDRTKAIHFHSLVGLFNCDDPLIEPNSLMSTLAARVEAITNKLTLRLHMLPSPGIVTKHEYQLLTQPYNGIQLIEKALAYKYILNIIVLSMGHWGAGHNSLFDYITTACNSSRLLTDAWEKSKAKLAQSGIIGDVAWCPIGKNGIISVDTELEIIKMLTLEEMCNIVYGNHSDPRAKGVRRENGKSIVLVSPCKSPNCQRSKGDLLAALMQMPKLPASHIIADWKSIRDCRAALNLSN